MDGILQESFRRRLETGSRCWRCRAEQEDGHLLSELHLVMSADTGLILYSRTCAELTRTDRLQQASVWCHILDLYIRQQDRKTNTRWAAGGPTQGRRRGTKDMKSSRRRRNHHNFCFTLTCISWRSAHTCPQLRSSWPKTRDVPDTGQSHRAHRSGTEQKPKTGLSADSEGMGA